MAAVDAALANRITGWGALSVAKTEAAIDALVDEHDPGALRRSRESKSSPTVEFGSPTDVAGTTSMWARLNSPDAALIEHSVEELAGGVCDADPRSINERRADALFAAVTHTAMACECGQPECPGAAQDRPAKNAVVYVVADEKSVDAATAETAAFCAPPAYVFGAGVLPSTLLGGIVERRDIREVRPRKSAPEPRHIDTRSTADVRALPTCRFPVDNPGLDRPADGLAATPP